MSELDINVNDHQEVFDNWIGHSNAGDIYGVVLASIVGFLTNWWCGLIVAVIFAIFTSIVVVIVIHRSIRQIQAGQCDDKSK